MHRTMVRALCAGLILLWVAGQAAAAPYAEILMDARDGTILKSSNADARLHPASTTKMMTLYLVFEALKRGRLKPNQLITISKHAASQPPSRLGLRPGQRVTVMDLVRAAAVKSANDAATALGEAVAGSEREFGRMMTAKAAALGMRNSRFLNANGLSVAGHYSSARDMAVLGRRLYYDFPQYFGIFGISSSTSAGKTLHTTNRLLASYPGVDGIKTGYTRPAGYNLVASASRGKQRMIAVVFGGRSSRGRNERVAELLDIGFAEAPMLVAEVRPTPTRDPGIRKVERPRPRSVVPADLIEQSVAAVERAILPAAAAAETSPLRLASTTLMRKAPLSVHAPRHAVRPLSKPVAPRPGPKTVPAKQLLAKSVPARTAPAKPVALAPAKTQVWAIQLGAFKDRKLAAEVAEKVRQRKLAALKGAKQVVAPVTVRGVSLFRTQFTGLSESAARKACESLRRISQNCAAVKRSG